MSECFGTVPQTEQPEFILDERWGESWQGDQSITHLKCSGCESNSLHLMVRMGSLTKKSVRVYTCLSPPKSRALAATAHRIFRPLLCAFKLVGMDNATVRESMVEKWECARPRLSHNIQIIYKSAQGRLEIVCSPL